MIKEYKKGLSVKLSKSFISTEFDCHCKRKTCTITLIDTDLIKRLQIKRNLFGKPMTIISGHRCNLHNQSLPNAKPGSFHLIGKAADIEVEGMSHPDLQKQCEDFDGLGKGVNITHVDVRGYKARWRY